MSAAKDAPPPLPEPLGVAVADSHTHLDMQSTTVEEALVRAASVGVTTVVQVGCDLKGSQWAADTAEAYENVHAAVALHPNEAPRIVLGDPDGWSRQGARQPGGDAALDDALAEIDRLAALPHVKAVGETGLDYFRTGADGMAAQERSFRAHIEIAKRHGKALVIHDREAHADVLRILREEGAPERTVFHCYSGDAEMAELCAESGYFMSFAGNMTFKNACRCATRWPSRPRTGPGRDGRALPHAGAVPRTAQCAVSHSDYGARHGGGEVGSRGRAGRGHRGEHGARLRLLTDNGGGAPSGRVQGSVTTLRSRIALDSDRRSANVPASMGRPAGTLERREQFAGQSPCRTRRPPRGDQNRRAAGRAAARRAGPVRHA